MMGDLLAGLIQPGRAEALLYGSGSGRILVKVTVEDMHVTGTLTSWEYVDEMLRRALPLLAHIYVEENGGSLAEAAQALGLEALGLSDEAL